MSQVSRKPGLVMVYTGNGKGKTTAALGLALRSIGHGHKVGIVQFMKGSKKYGELQATDAYLANLVIIQSGLETFVNRQKPAQLDIDLAQRGLQKAREMAICDEYNLLILDEVNVAIDYGLLTVEELIALIKEKPPSLNLVLTGRGLVPELAELAHLVSEVVEVKHHYTSGVEAREGIEF